MESVRKCDACNEVADFTPYDQGVGAVHPLCQDHFERWSGLDKESRKSLLPSGKRLAVRLSQAETMVGPSHMQLALMKQEQDARHDEIVAKISEMGRVLHEDD